MDSFNNRRGKEKNIYKDKTKYSNYSQKRVSQYENQLQKESYNKNKRSKEKT